MEVEEVEKKKVERKKKKRIKVRSVELNFILTTAAARRSRIF